MYGINLLNYLKVGKLISSIEVFEELQDDDLKEWIKEYKESFKPLTKDIQDEVTKILKECPQIINLKKNKKSSSNADPFLIATAICENGIVVTNENKNGEFKIPKICQKYNIECINLDDFLKKVLD